MVESAVGFLGTARRSPTFTIEKVFVEPVFLFSLFSFFVPFWLREPWATHRDRPYKDEIRGHNTYFRYVRKFSSLFPAHHCTKLFAQFRIMVRQEFVYLLS